MYRNIQPIKLLMFLILGFQLCYSLYTFQTITLETKQIYTLTAGSPLILKVSGFSSDAIGTLNITVTPINSQASGFVILTHQKCEDDLEQKELPFEQPTYYEGFSTLSFVANTSDSLCFQIDLANDNDSTSLNYSIQVTFSPLDILQATDQPYNIELTENMEKEFGYKYEGHSAEVIRITVQDDHRSSQKNANSSKLQLKQFRRSCIESKSETSWLCHLPNQQGLLKFTLSNPYRTESYKILISTIKNQEISSTSETMLTSSVPGFGSFITVNLPCKGVLKVNAKTYEDKYLSITGAPSLYNLFNILAGGRAELSPKDTTLIATESLILQNKQNNTKWYYFVKEEKREEFFILASYFHKQATLEVGVQEIYYIDPDLYEYQHIDLKIGTRHLLEKYEITLRAEESESPMNLYLDTNSYSIGYSLFPDQHLYKKKAYSAPLKVGELILSFIAEIHDTSAYLSIQALNKGFYVIKTKRVETESVWESVFISTLVFCMIACLFACLAKVFTLIKLNEFDDLPEWPPFQRGSESPNISADANGLDLEVNLPRTQIVEITENPSTRQLLPEVMNMMKKLKKQEILERSKKLKNHYKKEEDKEENKRYEVIEINEEERCDICYEARKTVVFEPCDHKCACAFCSLIIIQTSGQCPLCRGDIIEVQVTKDKIKGNINEVSDQQNQNS